MKKKDKMKQRKQEIEELLACGITIIEEKEIVGGIFSGEKVVLTGSLQNYKRSEAGKIIEENTPEQFFSNPTSDRVKLFLSKVLY